jgi:death on curing protein
MTEPVWLPVKLVIAIHDEQLRVFGGPAGSRDRGLLESALARPANKWSLGEPDLAALAAAYAVGVARNHPFIDGNKRAAFLAIIVFLGVNDINLVVNDAHAAVIIDDMAAGQVSEENLTRWPGDNWPTHVARTNVARTKA